MASKRKLRDGLVEFGNPIALFADGDDVAPGVIEREIGLTGEYKTRKFALARKQFEQVVENHKASGVDAAVDRGHESWTAEGQNAPAHGWVRELSIRPSKLAPNRDALVAKIELNDLGAAAVEKKHWRYLSMGIDLKATDKMTGEPIGAVLDHLALVKRPFIEGMEPLSLSDDAAFAPQEKPIMKLALKALGLDSDADESEALTAITEMKDFERNALALSGKSNRGEALGVLTALASKAERADKLHTELADLKSVALKAEINGLVDEAVKDGRVEPAKRADMIALADKATIDGLKACLSLLPKKVMSASESPTETAGGDIQAFSAMEIQFAKAFVGDDQAAIAARITEVRAAGVNPLAPKK